jgi:hypothetical protein
MMMLPMAIVGISSSFIDTRIALLILAGMGLLGIVFHKSLITLCVHQFNKRKYILAQGFRESE